jgi:hypothetical protein
MVITPPEETAPAVTLPTALTVMPLPAVLGSPLTM